MEFLWIVGLAFATLVLFLIGSGTNAAAMVATPLFFLCAIALYFSPALVARRRGHGNATAITVLNVVLGWTLVGWIAALIWSFTASNKEAAPIAAAESADRPRPTPNEASALRACPYCAESIQPKAKVCRFCGRDVEPL